MSSRKPPSNPNDWDDFDIPTWDDSASNVPTRNSPTRSPSARPPSNRSPYPDPLYDDYEQQGSPSRQSARPAQPSQQQPPRLSSRVPTRTTRPSQQDPYRDPYSSAEDRYAADPYYDPAAGYDNPRYDDAYQQPRGAASQYDLYAEPAVDAGWDEAAVYDEAPGARRRSRSKTRSARPSVSVARPAISDGVIFGIICAALVSLIAMAIAVWYGLGDVADMLPWHLNASGDVDKWASDSALWRIPFGSLMALAIGLLLGAYLWKRDRFAARFIITSMCIVQVLAWVAVIDQLW